MLLENTVAQAKSLLHSLEQTSECIGLHMNANKTGSMGFKLEGAISTLSGRLLKLGDKFTNVCSNILSTESDVTLCLEKAQMLAKHR